MVSKIRYLADLAFLHETDLLVLVLRMMAYGHEGNRFTSDDSITGEVRLSSLHLVLKAGSCSYFVSNSLTVTPIIHSLRDKQQHFLAPIIRSLVRHR